MEDALAANGSVIQMTTAVTAVTSWAAFTHVLLISSGVRMADVSQGTGPVMVTMTVEISVMKPKQTAAGKKLPLLEGAVGGNFSAALTGAASLSCGAAMERRTARMAAMRKAAMELSGCVMRKQSSPAGVQGDALAKRGYVMAILIVRISLMRIIARAICVDHQNTLVLMIPPSAYSLRSSAMGEEIALMDLMKAIFVMNVRLTMVGVAISVLWFLEEELCAPALQDSILLQTTKLVRLWISAPSTSSVAKFVNSIKILSSAHVMKAGSSVRMERVV